MQRGHSCQLRELHVGLPWQMRDDIVTLIPIQLGRSSVELKAHENEGGYRAQL